MAVLVRLQTKPLNYSQAFIADYTIGITIVLLQTVPTLTVLTAALSVDSHVPRRFPYCTVLLALSTVGSLEAGCRLQANSLRNSCLKVDMCERYSIHLVLPFIYAVYEFGYWGNVHWVFHMGISGPILRTASHCYGYEIRNQLSVEWQRHRFPGIQLHRQ
jgi:hypothetical protein